MCSCAHVPFTANSGGYENHDLQTGGWAIWGRHELFALETFAAEPGKHAHPAVVSD